MSNKYDWIVVEHQKEIWLTTECDCGEDAHMYLNEQDLNEMLKSLTSPEE